MTSLSTLRSLLSAGTPGEWTVTSEWAGDHYGVDVVRGAANEVICECDEHAGGYGGGHRNVELIASLHGMAPALLDLAEAAVRWRDRGMRPVDCDALLAAIDKVQP